LIYASIGYLNKNPFFKLIRIPNIGPTKLFTQGAHLETRFSDLSNECTKILTTQNESLHSSRINPKIKKAMENN